ncbi:MAG: hypothetical protein ACI9D0_000521 [Bacteroidia bacterium]|jgi:hypothetical protein
MYRENDAPFKDDLLEPSLTETHNVTRVLGAFDPSSVAWASFFVGPFGAAYLVLRNNGLLRIRDLAWLAPLVAAVVLAVPQFFDRELYTFLQADTWRLVVRGVTVIATYLATKKQRVRFRIYQVEGGLPKSLWGEGALAFAINIGLSIAYLMLVSAIASI